MRLHRKILLFDLVLRINHVIVLLLLAARGSAAVGGGFGAWLRAAGSGLGTGRLVDLLAELEARLLENFHGLLDAIAVVALERILQVVHRALDIAANIAADLVAVL